MVHVNCMLDTHPEYVILIAFPLQQWLHETCPNVMLYVNCLVYPHFICLMGSFWKNIKGLYKYPVTYQTHTSQNMSKSNSVRFSFTSHYNMKWQRKKVWPKFLNWHPHSKHFVMLWFMNGACNIYTWLVWFRNTPALFMGLTMDPHLTCRARLGVCVVYEIACHSILKHREHRI